MSTKLRVFYAEDSDDDAFFMARAVTKAGLPIHLQVWPDGLSIIDALKEQQPDVVLLDLQMPGATGLEVLRWMREANSPARRVPAVLFSSSGLAADVREAYRLGDDAFVTKASNGEEWMAIISGVFGMVAQGHPPDRIPGLLKRDI